MPTTDTGRDNIEAPHHLPVGAGADRRSIAYLTRPGNAPGVFWMSGFKSEMRSIKASYLDQWAAARGHAFTRFDYSGHGLSQGRFEDGTLSRWLEEAAAVFDAVTQGPQIVVGSSMGGYLALLMARQFLARTGIGRPGRIAGLVLIAPAWNMTDLMWKKAPDEARRAILDDGVWLRPSRYEDGPYPITRALIEDGRAHLFADAPWSPGAPVEIIQGRNDPDVPYHHVAQLTRLLIDVPVTLNEVPDGEHRLSRPEDLALLAARIEHLLDAHAPG